MNVQSEVTLSGARSFKVKRRGSFQRPSLQPLREVVREALPSFNKTRAANIYLLLNLINIWRGFWRIAVARLMGIPTYYGSVYAQVVRNGVVVFRGLVSLRVVTTTGVNYLVDSLQGTTEPENMKFHGFGIGTTNEAAGDTALVTELTTEYTTNSTRPTGSQTEGASANIYRTVATLTPDSGGVLAITEHGIFSQAATGGGTLLDRSKFAALNLDSANGDSLQITYDLTLPAGS